MKVSIITISFNSAETLQDTIHSVAMQSYSDIEYIIIDGGSTDETLDIINKNYRTISYWVSEPDKGIYDAMNKGIRMATGDIIAILNSDDFYVHTDVISQVVEHFQRSGADSVYGDIQYIDRYEPNRVVRNWVSGYYQRHKFLLGWMPPHPAFFVKRTIYETCGNFDTRLKTSADYELMLRFLFKHKISTQYLPELIVHMRAGGVSNQSWKKRILANLEDRRAWKLNGLRPYFFTAILKPLRKINQFLVFRTDYPDKPRQQKHKKQLV